MEKWSRSFFPDIAPCGCLDWSATQILTVSSIAGGHLTHTLPSSLVFRVASRRRPAAESLLVCRVTFNTDWSSKDGIFWKNTPMYNSLTSQTSTWIRWHPPTGRRAGGVYIMIVGEPPPSSHGSPESHSPIHGDFKKFQIPVWVSCTIASANTRLVCARSPGRRRHKYLNQRPLIDS